MGIGTMGIGTMGIGTMGIGTMGTLEADLDSLLAFRYDPAAFLVDTRAACGDWV
ncbi:MAG: hypothetical protein R3E01_24410 [Pirellulaceae bacterium]